MTETPTSDVTRAASELRNVLGRLVRRLRVENTLPITQGTVLARLERDGPQTTSALAAAERMRPQSMAQTVKELEAGGLVVRRPDARDRRRLLVELTGRGRRALTSDRTRREGWLAETIARQLTPAEQQTLVRAIALLERLARHDDRDRSARPPSR
jgi:DNA-binding MarR family transcriptional regulator